MITVTLLTGSGFRARTPLTLAALNKVFGGLTIQTSGSVGGGDLTDNTVTPAKCKQGAWFYADSSSYSSGAYTATFSPAPAALESGMVLAFRVTTAFTTPHTPTFSPNGLTAKPILRQDGGSLIGDDLRVNSVAEVRYNASANGGSGAWILISAPTMARARFERTSGTSTALTLTLPNITPTLTSLVGQVLTFQMHVTCGANPTLAVNGLAATALKWARGVSVAAGDLLFEQMVSVVYETDNGSFTVIGRKPVNQYWAEQASGGANTYNVTVADFPEAYAKGQVLWLKPTSANTGASNLNITPEGGSAIGLTAIRKYEDVALEGGELIANLWHQLIFNGTYWELVSPHPSVRSATFAYSASGSNNYQVTHDLGTKPSRYWVVFERIAGQPDEHGYAAGDEIALDSLVNGLADSYYNLSANATLIEFTVAPGGNSLRVRRKSDRTVQVPTATSWQYRVYWMA